MLEGASGAPKPPQRAPDPRARQQSRHTSTAGATLGTRRCQSRAWLKFQPPIKPPKLEASGKKARRKKGALLGKEPDRGMRSTPLSDIQIGASVSPASPRPPVAHLLSTHASGKLTSCLAWRLYGTAAAPFQPDSEAVEKESRTSKQTGAWALRGRGRGLLTCGESSGRFAYLRDRPVRSRSASSTAVSCHERQQCDRLLPIDKEPLLGKQCLLPQKEGV